MARHNQNSPQPESPKAKPETETTTTQQGESGQTQSQPETSGAPAPNDPANSPASSTEPPAPSSPSPPDAGKVVGGSAPSADKAIELAKSITHAELRQQRREARAGRNRYMIEQGPNEVSAFEALQLFLACMARLPEREKQGNLKYLEHQARQDLGEIEAWAERQRVAREADEDEEDRMADKAAADAAAAAGE
jgi:hypothetical protein